MHGVAKTTTGGFFITGFKEVTQAQQDLYLGRTDNNGTLIWGSVVGKGGPDQGYAVVATPDGGVAATGVSFPSFLGQESNAYMVKADGNGLIFTSYLEGNIFYDHNLNCTRETGEEGLEDWIVKIESPTFSARYAIADEDGNFRLAVDTGALQLTVFSANLYWQPCSAVTTVQVPAFYDTIAVNIPIQETFACPRNEIDVATPVLHRCDTNTYTVRYCNTGTAPSLDTRVQLHLDTFLTLTGSSIPPFQQTGNTYTFLLGTLDAGECGTFTVDAYLACDGTVMGQTHCVEAHITPDTACIISPEWNGSIVKAKAICDGDSVQLSLSNDTPFPTPPLEYVIAEEVIMLTVPNSPNQDYTFDYQIGGNDSIVVYSGPANGKTYRLIAQQSPGYPGESPITTAAVEGCISDTSSNPVSLGYYTMFPNDDQEPFLSTDCQESSDTDYNPTFLKRGHPKGYDVDHYIDPQTDLEYLIRFQNTGATTVQNVIIRDTLSAALDPGTVYPGAASHPYQFDVYGNGIVQFTISAANLVPGSSGAEGFVKFRVKQKSDLPCNTQIFNTAAIYFDYQVPQFTNETFHTVCERDSFVTVQTKEIFVPGADVKIYPNPFASSTLFEINGVAAQSYTLELYDTQGRQIIHDIYTHPYFRLYRDQIPSGILFYRLLADGRLVAAGKLIAD